MKQILAISGLACVLELIAICLGRVSFLKLLEKLSVVRVFETEGSVI